MKTIESEYRQKLNGYRCAHRNRWLLISSGIISLQALSLLEFYIDVSDFDQNHKAYGTFQVNFIEISKVFFCSQGTVRNWHKELVRLKFILPTKQRRVFQLCVSKRYASPGFWKGEASAYAKLEKDQTVEMIFQSMTKEFESVVNNVQPDKENYRPRLNKTLPRAIASSKGKYRVGSKGLAEEDKQWINKNIE